MLMGGILKCPEICHGSVIRFPHSRKNRFMGPSRKAAFDAGLLKKLRTSTCLHLGFLRVQKATSDRDVTTSKFMPITSKCRRPHSTFWFSFLRRSSLSSVLLVSRTK